MPGPRGRGGGRGRRGWEGRKERWLKPPPPVADNQEVGWRRQQANRKPGGPGKGQAPQGPCGHSGQADH